MNFKWKKPKKVNNKVATEAKTNRKSAKSKGGESQTPTEQLIGSGKINNEAVKIYDVDYELLDILAPDGCEPRNNGHLIINDFGNDIYIRTLYVSDLPTNADFAVTFSSILNYPDSNASVIIDALDQDKASSSLDKDILNIETEMEKKNASRNQIRKLQAKRNDVETFAYKAENNHSRMSMVAILISIYADSLTELNKRTADLFHAARKNTIQLVNCYGYQYEAFMAQSPLNNSNKYLNKANSVMTSLPEGITWHRMDQHALACIFNHTTVELYHESGVYMAYSLSDRSPIVIDLYDKSHKGYGVVISGTTGGGKSLTLKQFMSRSLEEGFKFVLLDSESPGKRGEYTSVTEEFNGVNYYFAPGSKEILNIFEIEEEEVYDEVTGKEWITLELNEKIIDVKHNIMSMVQRGKSSEMLGLHYYSVESIISDITQDLYRKMNLIEGDASSLYESSSSTGSGLISSGRKKKKLPVLSDFYVELIKYKAREVDETKLTAISILLVTMKEYVRELRVCHSCGKVHTVGEFKELQPIADESVRYRKCLCEGQVEHIQGTQPYYDGQSTISVTNRRIVNLDISQLNENEKPIAQAIALSYIKEKFIKKNAMNPLKAQKLGVVFDEVHKTFKYEDARELVINVYRIARKRHVAPITATQSLADYTLYPDTDGIIKNAVMLIILAHKVKDMKALSELTELTDTQIRQVVMADVGECYIVDNGKAVHAKIDYLKHVEAKYLETNIDELKKIRENEIADERFNVSSKEGDGEVA